MHTLALEYRLEAHPTFTWVKSILHLRLLSHLPISTTNNTMMKLDICFACSALMGQIYCILTCHFLSSITQVSSNSSHFAHLASLLSKTNPIVKD